MRDHRRPHLLPTQEQLDHASEWVITFAGAMLFIAFILWLWGVL
jgi:hypothetical protein